MRGSKCDEYCIFLGELFRFTKKFSSLLTLFEIFLPQLLMMFSTNLNYSVICSFTKRVYKIAMKNASIPKHFLEVTKGIERLLQNALDKLRF